MMDDKENKRIYADFSREEIMVAINDLIGEKQSWTRLNRNDLIKVHTALFNLKYGALGTQSGAVFKNKKKDDLKKRLEDFRKSRSRRTSRVTLPTGGE